MPGRKITFSQLVQRADPRHNQESRNPIEYEFSNGRIFRGAVNNRFAYNLPPDFFRFNPLKADGSSLPLKADGSSIPLKGQQP